MKFIKLLFVAQKPKLVRKKHTQTQKEKKEYIPIISFAYFMTFVKKNENKRERYFPSAHFVMW